MSILLSICCVEEKKQREDEGREGKEVGEEQGRGGGEEEGEEMDGEDRRGVGHVNFDNSGLCGDDLGERGVTGLEKTTGVDDFWQDCVWSK